MKLHHLSLCSLLFTSPLLGLILPTSVAIAQENVVFPTGVEELVPGEPSVADGSTQATYYFVLLNKDGSPMEGVTGKTSLSGAKGILKSEGNGLYSTTLIPETINQATNDFIQINAKTPERKSIRKSFQVRLLPAPSGTLSIRTSPEEITLGQDDFVTLNIQAPKDLSANDLNLSVSTGSVDNLIALGNGQFSARFTPSTKKTYPHVAVFTLSSQHNPDLYTHFVLKQKGKANFAVNTNPNSNVIIRINDRDFGPIQTDASGKASVPIVAPPGQQDATLIVISNEQRKEELLDLRIPKNVPRANLVPPMREIPGDGETIQTLYAFVATAEGVPDTAAQVTCRAKFGQCENVTAIGEGYYSIRYIPPVSNLKATEEIQLIVSDPAGDIVDTESFTILPVLPGKVDLKTVETVLPKELVDFGLTIQVKDNLGKGLEDRGLIVQSVGAKQTKAPVSLGSGDYTVKLRPTSQSPIEVTTMVKGSSSTNPPFGIAMRSNYDRLPNDGVSTSLLTFAIYDRFGQPVANQDITLKLEGTGTLDSNVKTSASGFATTTYTAGTDSGLIKITATSGELSSQFVLFVAPKEALSNLPTLTRSQNQIHQRLQSRLFGSINHIRFEREGMEGVALTGEVDKVGMASQMTLASSLQTVAPSEKVIITIQLTDEQNRGVAGEELNVMASSGSIGRLDDLGNGQYEFSIIAPNDGDNITVVVSSVDQTLRQELSVSISAPIPQVTEPTIVSELTENTEGVKETKKPKESKPKKEPKSKKEKVPKAPRSATPSDSPTLRTSIGYVGGTFNYQQVPTSTTGLLYEKAITFNRQTEGSSPAYTAGVDLRAFGTVPTISNLGYDLHVQSDYYAIALSQFPEPIGDWMTSVDAMIVGQYPLNTGSIRVTPQIRAGLLRDDLIVFRQDIQDNGNIELAYEPLFVTALNLGLGTDIETGFGLFAHLTYDVGVRGSIYRQKLDSQVGYQVTDSLYGFVGGRSTIRNVDIEVTSGKAGEIHDGNYSFVAGVGGSFQ